MGLLNAKKFWHSKAHNKPGHDNDKLARLDAAAADLDRARFLGHDKPELTDFIRSPGEDKFPEPWAMPDAKRKQRPAEYWRERKRIQRSKAKP